MSLLIRQSLLVFLLRLFDVSFSSDRPAQAFKDDKITHILQIRKHYRPKISHFGRKISCELDFWSCKRAKSGTKVRSFFGIRKFFTANLIPSVEFLTFYWQYGAWDVAAGYCFSANRSLVIISSSAPNVAFACCFMRAVSAVAGPQPTSRCIACCRFVPFQGAAVDSVSTIVCTRWIKWSLVWQIETAVNQLCSESADSCSCRLCWRL